MCVCVKVRVGMCLIESRKREWILYTNGTFKDMKVNIKPH